jgi:hypothetical protein
MVIHGKGIPGWFWNFFDFDSENYLTGGNRKLSELAIQDRRGPDKNFRLIFLVEFILRDLSISRQILATSTQVGLRVV